MRICTGERSSRRIETKLADDVAYRVIAANQHPDHATLARFRQRHEAAIAELFSQMLHLCVEADLVDTKLVAIDGTKMEADASDQANKNARALAEEILREAERTDAEEDEPGFKARRISPIAAVRLGIVQRVHVESTASNFSESSSNRSPLSPACSTGTDDRAIRVPQSAYTHG